MNEKNDAVRTRFRTYALTTAGAALIALVGLGMVHQHNLHHDLARQGLKLDDQIRMQRIRLQQAWEREAQILSPVALEARVRELNLGLTAIQGDQRLFLRRTHPVAAPLRIVPAPNPPLAPSGPLPPGLAMTNRMSPPVVSSTTKPGLAVRRPARAVVLSKPLAALNPR